VRELAALLDPAGAGKGKPQRAVERGVA